MQDSRQVYDEALLRRVLLYQSSALDIATGPLPKVNALDMLVFAKLGRGALEQHWIPQRFGKEGEPLVEAFAGLERASWETLTKFLDGQQQADLLELIAAWQEGHPEQYRVAGVRFQEFSEQAGEIDNERMRKASGLLGQIRSASMAAGQALLISERALFVAHRMPFLIRLQCRLAVQETLSDSMSRLDDVEALLQRIKLMQPMLADLVALTSNAQATVRETHAIAEMVEPHLDRFTKAGGSQSGPGMAKMLESANRLTEQSLALVRELRGALPGDPERTIDAVEQRVDHAVRRWIIYVLMAALAWTAFFWCAYFLATL